MDGLILITQGLDWGNHNALEICPFWAWRITERPRSQALALKRPWHYHINAAAAIPPRSREASDSASRLALPLVFTRLFSGGVNANSVLSVNGKKCKLTPVAWTHVWRCIQASVCVYMSLYFPFYISAPLYFSHFELFSCILLHRAACRSSIRFWYQLKCL